MGAARFAQNQTLVRSRIPRLTYGCRIRATFDPARDAGRKPIREPHDTVDHCDNVFDVFVTAGEKINVDHEVKRTYCPVKPDQKVVKLHILGTKATRVHHGDEPGVEHLGTLDVLTPDTTGGVQRQIEVTMYFGQTKVRVRAVDKTTGEDFHRDVDFFTH